MPGTSAFPVLTARGTGHLAQGPARVQRGPAPESVDHARRHVVLYVLRRSTWLIVLITYVVGRRMNSPVLPSIRSLCINALHFRVPSIRISTSHASLSSQCSCIIFHPAPITASLTLLPKRVFSPRYCRRSMALVCVESDRDHRTLLAIDRAYLPLATRTARLRRARRCHASK